MSCKMFYFNKFMLALSAAIFLVASVSAESAACDDLTIVPFEEWSGEPIRRKEALAGPVKLAIIQHTVTSECTTDASCSSIMRTMRAHHIQIGFDDIGYSFVVGGNGKVYEGAGWHLVGAHTVGYNRASVGIAFFGNFMDKEPSMEAQTAAKLLLQCADGKKLAEDYALMGHRQLISTLSPGDKLQSIIETWPHWTDKLD